MTCPTCRTELLTSLDAGRVVLFCRTCWTTVPGAQEPETGRGVPDTVVTSPQPVSVPPRATMQAFEKGRAPSAEASDGHGSELESPRTFTVEFPLPPCDLGGNVHSRRHWRYEAKARRLYHESCSNCLPLPGHSPHFEGPVRITLDYYMSRNLGDKLYRPRDVDNAIRAAKCAVDALVTAGILMGDSYRYVRGYEVILRSTQAEHGGRCCLIVTVTEEV